MAVPPTGTLIPERIILRAGKLLRPGGLLVMEHDISQGERLAAYANAHGFANTRYATTTPADPDILFRENRDNSAEPYYNGLRLVDEKGTNGT